MIKSLLLSFFPAPLNTKPNEWVRASIGACTGTFLCALIGQYFFGLELTLRLLGPIGASAVLLFAVSSGALAQPWSIIGSYFVSTLSAIVTTYFLGHSLISASAAAGMAICIMCMLRCLHPPGGALALCIVLSKSAMENIGFHILFPVMTNAVTLVICALIYNNLTHVRYPKTHANPSAEINHTKDIPPFERIGFNSHDLDAALDDIGEFVDVTRENLENIIRSTEKHALRRSMGAIQASDIMSKDVLSATPKTTIKRAIKVLTEHHIKTLPILDKEKRVIGIISLTDIVKHPNSYNRNTILRLLSFKSKTTLGEIMHTPVTCVPSSAHVVELIPLLSQRGLHCIPVTEHNIFVGVITQTDLIAALHRDLIMHLH